MAADTTLREPLSTGITRRHFSWLVASVIVAGGALLKGQTRPGPALWLAQEQGTRVYLFGQMPVRSDTVWLTPEIEAAFNSSDLVWLENLDNSLITPEVMNAVGELQKQLTPPEHLSVLSVLDEPHRKRLLAVLAAEGVRTGNREQISRKSRTRYSVRARRLPGNRSLPNGETYSSSCASRPICPKCKSSS
jgi:hypothetical protein